MEDVLLYTVRGQDLASTTDVFFGFRTRLVLVSMLGRR